MSRGWRRSRRRSALRDFGAPYLVGNAARILADRWPADAPQPSRSTRKRRPISPGWRGSEPRSAPDNAPARPFYLRAPDAKPAKGSPEKGLAAAIIMINLVRRWLSGMGRGGTALIEPATLRDAPGWPNCTARRFTAAGAKASSRRMLTERNTLVHRLRIGRKIIGFAVSRWRRTRPKYCRSRLRRAIADAACPRDLLLTHLGHLAGRGVRTVFLEVEENNQPARRLYERAGFGVAGRPGTLLPAGRRGTIERLADAPRLVVTAVRWQNSRRARPRQRNWFCARSRSELYRNRMPPNRQIAYNLADHAPRPKAKS